jgi:hypothetical protein
MWPLRIAFFRSLGRFGGACGPSELLSSSMFSAKLVSIDVGRDHQGRARIQQTWL